MTLVMGIDLGTSGVRAIIADARGQVIASASQKLTGVEIAVANAAWHEQDALGWWQTCQAVIRAALAIAQDNGCPPDAITALAVTSTSGTIVPLDAANRPLRPAFMYNDGRAVAESEMLNSVSSDLRTNTGIAFQPAFALCKVVWCKAHEPDIFAQTARWAHQGDYIVGHLTGDYGVSDYSTALKTGYDFVALRYPSFIADEAHIPLATLPRIVAPGDIIGTVSPEAAAATGLSTRTLVCAGMTDANTALLASGAAEPGEWNSAIGTTIGIKGMTTALIRDDAGRIYCHRHPDGWWLPGAASNAGGELLQAWFGGREMAQLDAAAEVQGAASYILYPLPRQGERFPFIAPGAERFQLGEPRDESDTYRACLEGVALVERLCFEVLEGAGATVGGQIYVTGGASGSAVWCQIRADVLGRELVRPRLPESAFGAALLAASHTLYASVSEAGRAMVQIDRRFAPNTAMRAHYDDKTARLRDEIQRRGWM
jgi:D-ribulokinase